MALKVSLDTNIVIDFLRGKKLTTDFIQKMGKQNLAISPMVVFEVLQGVRNKIELEKTQKELSGFILLELNQSITQVALSIYEKYILSHSLSIPDSIIAATALVYGLELRTLNLKDFQMIAQLSVSDFLE